MQLLIIDPLTYTPTRLVEGYSSLIWTERYVEPGEVEIVAASPGIVSLVPPGTLLGVVGSYEVAVVESHETNLNEQGYPEVTIRGRTVDGVLDNRIIWGPHGAALTLPRGYTYRDAALMYIWSSVVNTLANDVAHTVARPPALYLHSPIPNVVVTDSTNEDPVVTAQFSVNMGPAGDAIRQWLNDFDLGLRTIRPSGMPDPSKIVMVITANGASKGVVTKLDRTDFTELRLDVYRGVDRSRRQSVVPQIAFLGAAGHLKDVQVLDTDTDFTTDLVITTPTGTYDSSTPWSPPANGFSRKIEYIDGSPLVEGVAAGDQPIVINAYRDRYYAHHAGDGILTANVSEAAPYHFGEDYFMGDIVTLLYGPFERNVRVTEYTRTEDRNGQKEYPTFTAIPS